MSPALSMATSNCNNSNNLSSPLLRSPRRIKRDSTSLKQFNNSCGELMEDLRQQLSMPKAQSLPDQDEEDSHRTVVLSTLDDEAEVENEGEDDDLDDSSRASDSNTSDCSSASRMAARQLLLQNTQANSAGLKSTRTKYDQTSLQQQQQQHQQRKRQEKVNGPSITNLSSSDSSVASNQSTKSTLSLFSRLSRKSTRMIPNQMEDSDDKTTATASSTKSWWKKRREQKKVEQGESDKKKKKHTTIFQSFRLKRKRKKGRNMHEQLVADFFDVQSVASEPDFVGRGMVQRARLETSNRLLDTGDQDRRPLETRSVTSQNSRSHAFASFFLRLRQNNTDSALQGSELIGNQIEAHESNSEYDDEITLGSGFENLSLADSLDDSETAFQTNTETETAVSEPEVALPHEQCLQDKSEQRSLLSLEQPDPTSQSFLQRILNKTGSSGDDIILKAILAASSQPLLPLRIASTMPHENDQVNHNVSLNSTFPETDSDDNSVKEERLNHKNYFGDKSCCYDQVEEQESATITPQKHERLPMVVASSVGRGKSLMHGKMAKARSEHCLELLPNIADIYEYHPPHGSNQGNESINCSDIDDDDDCNNVTVPTAEVTAGMGSRWDSEASVASDTPMPRRPKRRITGQFSECDNDNWNAESAQSRSLQHHQPKQQQSSHPLSHPPDESKGENYITDTVRYSHSFSRPSAKPLASQSMRNLKTSDEDVDDESILSLLAGLLATWASEREVAAAEEEAIVIVEDLNNHTGPASSKNGGLKSILKNTAEAPILSSPNLESKEEEEEKTERLRLSVTFDFVETREYERVVGDNPSCTRGPPVAIGWIYQTGTMCPVDDYETLIRRPRRTKREFHLTAEQRTQILVDEWDCSEEDIRRARREATYIQYCRAKTSFSGSRVAAKEAAFLRKANENSKAQQHQHQRGCIRSECGGSTALPTMIPCSPTKSGRVHARPATPMSPSSRENRPNLRKTGRKIPPPIQSSPKHNRKAPPVVSISPMDRQNGSGYYTAHCPDPKMRPVSPANRPKTSPVSKYSPATTTLSSSSSATAEVLPTSRTLLEV